MRKRRSNLINLVVAGLIMSAALLVPSAAQAQATEGIVQGKQQMQLPVTRAFATNWKQLRVGMTEAQVYRLLGDYKFVAWVGIAGRDSYAIRAYSYFRKDWSRGFERMLWFDVEFVYVYASRDFRLQTATVDWQSEKWIGSGEQGLYDHIDVSHNFR